MDKDAILGTIRHVFTTIGGALSAKGIIAGSWVEPLTGAIIVFIGFAWSIYEKKQRKENTIV